MHVLLSLLIFALLSMAALSQGTMTTDNSEASRSAASLSGSAPNDVDLRNEEVQMQEDDQYAEPMDDGNVNVEEDSEEFQDSETEDRAY